MISIVVALIFQYDSKVCILKLVMLIKLAFVVQRLKKYLKKGQFLDFMGGKAVMRGDIELMGVPQSPH